MKLNIAIGCLLALILSACGGGGGGDQTTPAQAPAVTPAPTPAPVPKSILVFGDSTIVGEYSDTPPSVTLSLLSGLAVQNLAHNGTRLPELISGDIYYPQNLQQLLAVSSATIVIENFGINDAAAGTVESVSDYSAALTLYVSQVRAAGKTPVLEEPNPVCTGAAVDPAMLDQYVATLRNVAASTGTLLIPQYDAIKAIPNWQSMMRFDCVHPLTALTAIKAQNEYNAIKGLL